MTDHDKRVSHAEAVAEHLRALGEAADSAHRTLDEKVGDLEELLAAMRKHPKGDPEDYVDVLQSMQNDLEEIRDDLEKAMVDC